MSFLSHCSKLPDQYHKLGHNRFLTDPPQFTPNMLLLLRETDSLFK